MILLSCLSGIMMVQTLAKLLGMTVKSSYSKHFLIKRFFLLRLEYLFFFESQILLINGFLFLFSFLFFLLLLFLVVVLLSLGLLDGPPQVTGEVYSTTLIWLLEQLAAV